jgi:hypothetical protein
MTKSKLSAGDIIEARCTKCREILNHRIVAMVEDKVVRVECNTCNGVHNYHAPPVAKEVKVKRIASPSKPRSVSSTPRTPKKDPVELEREEWASLQPTFQPDRALPYDMNGKYQVRHLILHPVFGLGFVKTLIVSQKMKVLFKDGLKLLRCQ